MNVINDKCVEYFIEKRVLLESQEIEEREKQDLLNNHSELNVDIGIDVDKYHNMIIFGLVIYFIVLFSIVR